MIFTSWCYHVFSLQLGCDVDKRYAVLLTIIMMLDRWFLLEYKYVLSV